MYHNTEKTSSSIAMHRPQSTSCRIEEELMHKSAQAVDSTTDPLDKLRLLCLSRGAASIMGICRIFRALDKDGSNQLNKDQFLQGIKEAGFEINHLDAEGLFDKFDNHGTGSMNLDEIITKLRPPMSESRRNVVEKVFHKLVMLDKTGDGTVSVADIRGMYSPTAHPRYMSGEESSELILDKFLANFDAQDSVDGKVTPEEFMNYYSGISVSIEDDCFFDLMMRQAYKL